ncbi:MAG: 4Fe-4S binding protein, partial [Candidatus Bathyarchaeia archaeon]
MSSEASEPKIGVFVCKCGGNISDAVDVVAVCDEAKNWRGVAVADYQEFLCSEPAQAAIAKAIKERGLDRVVVASCTPRMHLSTFQSVLERSGLNPYLLEFVNIREQCSWVHGSQKDEATRKAIDLIRGGYMRSFELEPLEEVREKCSKDVLVVGGGIAGITASLELGDMGHNVHLVDRYPSIGGNMAKLTKVFPTIDCAQCILTPKMAEVGRHKNVRLFTYTEVEDVRGYPGNYGVTLYMKPRGVDVERCSGCGTCAKVCPATAPDEFNEYRSTRKAAYIPFRQAVPYAYTIDFDACKRCGLCEDSCPFGAIDLEDRGRRVKINVGAVVLATGYVPLDARELKKYGYGGYSDVITMMELERLTAVTGPTGGAVRRFDGDGDVKRLAIVLCAGSRDSQWGVPYCSRVCCMYSIKQAVLLKDMFGIDVWVYYIDMRAAGRGYEELYNRAQDMGVVFVRGRVSGIQRDNASGRLKVRSVDTLL